MKKRLTKTFILFAFICFTTIVKAQRPTLSNHASSNITNTSASLIVTVNSNGSGTSVDFSYATNNNLNGATTVNSTFINSSNTIVNRSVSLSNLSPNTTYYWQVSASNASGGALATLQSFTTLPNPTTKPTIDNITASPSRTTTRIDYKVSTLMAFTTNVKYGTDANNLTTNIVGTSGNGDNVAGFANLTGLTENTLYYYKVEASNTNGTTVSSVGSFTTAQLLTVAKFNFDGTKTDVGGNLTFGAGANTYVEDRKMQPNKALLFANNPVSVNIPAIPIGNQPRTISMWVKVISDASNTTNIYNLYGYGNANSFQAFGQRINFSSGKIVSTYINQANEFNVGPGGASSNGWDHYVASFDGGSLKFYFNGRDIASTGRPSLNTAFSDFFIGGNATGDTNFSGVIDDLTIFNQALTGQEVINLYDFNTTTVDENAKPLVNSVTSSSISKTTAKINYVVSSVAFTSNIKYGTDANNLINSTAGTASNGSRITSFANLTGLTAGTAYFYQVEVTNANGTTTSSPVASFITDPLSLVASFDFNDSLASKDGSLTFVSPNPFFFFVGYANDRNAKQYSAVNLTNEQMSANIPNLPTGKAARTISIWATVNTYVSNNYNFIYGYGTGQNNKAYGVAIFKSSTNVHTVRNYAFGDEITGTPNPFTELAWHHYVTTYDGTTANLYVDGVLTNSTPKTTWDTNSSNFFIGGNSYGDFNFTGQIDDLSIYNTVLTQQEITNLFNTNSTVLPVTLVSYTAKAQNNNALLNWKTASETNNSHFVIAKSTDGTNFNEIAKVNAKSTNGADYSYTDYNIASGTNYYRLTQVDLDGKTTNLGVKAVKISLADADVKLYPNPATDFVNLSFEAGMYAKATLLDINGKVISTVSIAKVQNSATIDLSKVAPGTYLLQLTGTNSKTIRKVIKR